MKPYPLLSTTWRARALLILLLSLPATQAAEPLVTFDDPAQLTLYTTLTNELRCLKCQNQTIADSPAGLAIDLRREIQEQIVAGRDAAEIKQYMVDRYGDFVLYRPRFNIRTLLLWVGPILMLSAGLWIALSISRGRPETTSVVDADDLRKARSLLDDQ